MALIFPQIPIVFTLPKFLVRLFTQRIKMQLFGNDVIFSSSRDLVFDTCLIFYY